MHKTNPIEMVLKQQHKIHSLSTHMVMGGYTSKHKPAHTCSTFHLVSITRYIMHNLLLQVTQLGRRTCGFNLTGAVAGVYGSAAL